MARRILAALLVLSLGGLSSCYRYTTVSCQEEALHLHYKGFDVSQLDTVIVQQFEKGSGFSALAGTLHFTADSTTFANEADTLVPQSGVSYGVLTPGNDYGILIPKTGNTYHISDITLEGHTTETYREAYGVTYDRDPCVDHIISFQLDSITITPPRSQYEDAHVVLTR